MRCIWLIVAIVSCASTPPQIHVADICEEESVHCEPVLANGPPKLVTGARINWSPEWCQDKPVVCAWAIYHEAGHIHYGADEKMADCYAVAVAPIEQTHEVIRFFKDTDPDRAVRLGKCGAKP